MIGIGGRLTMWRGALLGSASLIALSSAAEAAVYCTGVGTANVLCDAAHPSDGGLNTVLRGDLTVNINAGAGITTRQIAEAAGIAEGTLSQMLKGPANRSSVAVPAISKMVGLPVPKLASGTVDEGDVGAQVNATIAALDDDDAETFRDMIESAIRHARRSAERARTKRS